MCCHNNERSIQRRTQLAFEHIETMWCPSILGEDLTRVVPRSADPGKAQGVSSARL